MPATLRALATSCLIDLEQMPVFVSASMPGALRGTAHAYKLQDFFVAFVRALLNAGGRLIFGGHPTITPLVHQVASEVSGSPRIELYQWGRFRGEEPEEAHDLRIFNLHWMDDPDSITPMREEMVRQARAAVFLGGKTLAENPVGGKPGIRDEYERYLRHRPQGPAYLLGFLGGEARLMITEGIDEPNSLSPVEKTALHETEFPDLAVSMILADLRRQVRAGKPDERGAASPAVFPMAAKKL